DINTPLTSMDISPRQKINNETMALNATLDQMELTDIFRTFHPKIVEYIFFSSAHGTFCKMDHMLGHKTNLSKLKKTEIISNIFSDHNNMKLEISYRKKSEKNTNTWRLNNMLLNKEWINQKIRKEI
ncbi:hypothetical protein PANDA_005982, partial [Ailuropoda melanoleuca]